MTKDKIKTTGEIFSDGKIIELIYDQASNKTKLAFIEKEEIKILDSVTYKGNTYIPYSENNHLIKNQIVLLPSNATDFKSIENLVSEIQSFIHKYVDLDPLFESIASYYVLLSWIYDAFNELPYLRKSGDFGTGKTRFLTVVGSLCYKPIFASGSSSTAALFHILDEFKGTLVFDEADFRQSDEKAELTKILNNGFMKGIPVLRCVFNKQKEFDPVAYSIFGCKLLATRKFFTDPALESRIITEKINPKKLRKEIPTQLPDSFKAQALELRNKLLMFRFLMQEPYLKYKTSCNIKGAEPRINQIFTPLLQLISDDQLKEKVETLAREYSKNIQNSRAETIEFHVLAAIRFLNKKDRKITVGDITKFITHHYSDFYERKVTARFVGNIISKSLGLTKHKASGRFYISNNQDELLNSLYTRYDVTDEPMS